MLLSHMDTLVVFPVLCVIEKAHSATHPLNERGGEGEESLQLGEAVLLPGPSFLVHLLRAICALKHISLLHFPSDFLQHPRIRFPATHPPTHADCGRLALSETSLLA